MQVKGIDFGTFVVTANKEFHYYDETIKELGMQMQIRPFVVKTLNDCILVDTGFDYNDDKPALIHEMLIKNGIQPSEITKVLMSHLHKDHSNGLVNWIDNTYIQNFPEAKIYIQKREFDFALQQINVKSYEVNRLQSLQDAKNIIWLNDDKGNITDQITYQVTGGHTPFHQVFWFKENDTILFFGGDNLPTKGFIDKMVAYKTDFDGKIARDLRKKWVIQAAEENWKMMLYHDKKRDFLFF